MDPDLAKLLFDAQTSGGLLAAVRHDQAEEALDRLHLGGDTASAVIGEVLPPGEGPLLRIVP